jgi:hypothetical protein
MTFRVTHQSSDNPARCPYRVVVQATGREIDWIMSVAAKKGTSLAVETEPGVGLRSGQPWAQACGRANCFPLSGRIVFGFDQRGAVGLAFDLEDDRLFDQAVEKSHRQRAINQILSPFVEVHVGHQRGGALLVA